MRQPASSATGYETRQKVKYSRNSVPTTGCQFQCEWQLCQLNTSNGALKFMEETFKFIFISTEFFHSALKVFLRLFSCC